MENRKDDERLTYKHCPKCYAYLRWSSERGTWCNRCNWRPK